VERYSTKHLKPADIRAFRREIYRYYREKRRKLPWRRTRDPYRILVSEVMLQQTHVGRVAEKYRTFIRAFPDFPSLARSPLREIFKVWHGLGYNRRALALKRIAERVVGEWAGKLPRRVDLLESLPGIGYATASSIAAFAFNIPSVFVETNIRTVFIHFFFPRRRSVRDREIVLLVAETLDRANPRLWYSALMDYGASLKERHGNPNWRSAHYRRQPAFMGSNRQLRGMVLRPLVNEKFLSESEMARRVKIGCGRLRDALSQLEREGLVKKNGQRFQIP